MKIAGFILIVIGLVALALQVITITKAEKVVDLGPLQVTAERKERVPLPPILGIVAVAAGVVLVVVSAKSTGK